MTIADSSMMDQIQETAMNEMIVRKIIVRDMEPHEKEPVRELFESVYKDTFSANVPIFNDAVCGERIFVAAWHGYIAGMATVWEPDAFIHYLFVVPEFRRQGIGRAIAEKLAVEYDKPLTLKCLVENTAAMAFYLSTGWTRIEEGHSEEGTYARLRYKTRRARPPMRKGQNEYEAVNDKMKFKIRIAVPADEQKIRDLFVEMLRTICNTEDAEGYEDGYLDKFWTGLEDRIYVAEDREVVAFLSVEVHHEPEKYIYLDDFSVTAAYRNKGIGSELIRAAESYAAENHIAAVLLHAEKTNEKAMRFYDRSGYSIYRDDGHRYLLKKDIPSA